MLLNEDAVLIKGDRAAKRLWLAGTIAAGMAANNHNWFAEDAVYMADKLLEALEKEKTK